MGAVLVANSFCRGPRVLTVIRNRFRITEPVGAYYIYSYARPDRDTQRRGNRSACHGKKPSARKGLSPCDEK